MLRPKSIMSSSCITCNAPKPAILNTASSLLPGLCLQLNAGIYAGLAGGYLNVK